MFVATCAPNELTFVPAFINHLGKLVQSDFERNLFVSLSAAMEPISVWYEGKTFYQHPTMASCWADLPEGATEQFTGVDDLLVRRDWHDFHERPCKHW